MDVGRAEVDSEKDKRKKSGKVRGGSMEMRSKKEKGKGSNKEGEFGDSGAGEFNGEARMEIKSRDKKKRKKKEGHGDSGNNGESNSEGLGRKGRSQECGDEVGKLVHGKKKIKKLRKNGDLDTPVENDLVNTNVGNDGASEELAKKKKEKEKKNESHSESVEVVDRYSDELGAEQPQRDVNKRTNIHGQNDDDTSTEKDLVNVTVDNGRESEKEKHSKKKKKRKRDEMQTEEDLVNATVDNERESEKEKPSKKKKKEKRDEVQTEEKNLENEHDGEATATEELKRKKHKKSKKGKDAASSAADKDFHVLSDEVEHLRTDKKQGKKVVDDDTADQGNKVKPSKKKKRSKSTKKVKFSDEVEICPIPVKSNDESIGEDGLLRGKRFTKEEDEVVRQAVYDYIDGHNLGENGLEMVLNCRKYPEAKGCWREIGLAIPYRPNSSIYYRAQILFRRSETRKWTKEEYEMLLQHQKEHGNEWKALAEELGRHRFHVKDTWRRIKLQNSNQGHWSQEEYQKLFNLVNVDLQNKISEEKLSKHGMLRDNICWTAISDTLETRTQAICCTKWYNQLTSPMVAQGLWSDTDDYRLLTELYNLDANCMQDVNWDDLIEHRSGDICRKRWNQMVLHIGHHGIKSFAEQVEVLAQRYCPHLLEARDIWDSKPRVR